MFLYNPNDSNVGRKSARSVEVVVHRSEELDSCFIHLPLQSTDLGLTFRFDSPCDLYLVVGSSESPGETGRLDERILCVVQRAAVVGRCVENTEGFDSDLLYRFLYWDKVAK